MDSRQTEIHPGEVLRDEFMLPLGLSSKDLAAELGIPSSQLGAVVGEHAPITANLAVRLAGYFKVDPQFWLNLQAEYDARNAANALLR
jgi:addiction module HigA family antidote